MQRPETTSSPLSSSVLPFEDPVVRIFGTPVLFTGSSSSSQAAAAAALERQGQGPSSVTKKMRHRAKDLASAIVGGATSLVSSFNHTLSLSLLLRRHTDSNVLSCHPPYPSYFTPSHLSIPSLTLTTTCLFLRYAALPQAVGHKRRRVAPWRHSVLWASRTSAWPAMTKTDMSTMEEGEEEEGIDPSNYRQPDQCLR